MIKDMSLTGKISFFTMIFSILVGIIIFTIGLIVENHHGNGYIHDQMIWIEDMLIILLSLGGVSAVVWFISMMVYINDI